MERKLLEHPLRHLGVIVLLLALMVPGPMPRRPVIRCLCDTLTGTCYCPHGRSKHHPTPSPRLECNERACSVSVPGHGSLPSPERGRWHERAYPETLTEPEPPASGSFLPPTTSPLPAGLDLSPPTPPPRESTTATV